MAGSHKGNLSREIGRCDGSIEAASGGRGKNARKTVEPVIDTTPPAFHTQHIGQLSMFWCAHPALRYRVSGKMVSRMSVF